MKDPLEMALKALPFMPSSTLGVNYESHRFALAR